MTGSKYNAILQNGDCSRESHGNLDSSLESLCIFQDLNLSQDCHNSNLKRSACGFNYASHYTMASAVQSVNMIKTQEYIHSPGRTKRKRYTHEERDSLCIFTIVIRAYMLVDFGLRSKLMKQYTRSSNKSVCALWKLRIWFSVLSNKKTLWPRHSWSG
jgi:hypothetical protein